jgi:hypothetical protein
MLREGRGKVVVETVGRDMGRRRGRGRMRVGLVEV